MKQRISILLMVLVVVLASAGFSSLMTGCASSDDGGTPKAQQNDLRDDPDAVTGEEETFKVDEAK